MRTFPALLGVCLAASLHASEAPRIVNQDGRYALLVDGRPYLVLGAQINNSSAWPAVLPEVWPTLEAMHANTAEVPVYWEQLEPQPGKFDFGVVDEVLRQAREHRLHLVLLWFGTWKNGQMHYAPAWVKSDPAKYPRMIKPDGRPIDVLSANAPSNLEADKAGFVALTRHLKEIDSDQHTVLLIQVENESGGIGAVRDFSPLAQKQFEQQVPSDLVKALHKQPGTWSQVFPGEADEYFQAYYQSRYVNEIAKAGKAEFAVPMYINVWLSYPPAELPERRVAIPGIQYPSGGAVEKMIDLWKFNAPAIDMIGPDIYADDSGFYHSVMRAYHRPDNPLWIPETGSGDSYARFFFAALGDGAIGFSPFGIDNTGWTFALAAGPKPEDGPKLHTENYALIAPMDGVVARLNYEGKLKTAVEELGQASQEIDFGAWQATVGFGFPQNDGRRPPGTRDLVGRVLIAQLAPNEFLVTGFDASVSFHVPGELPGQRSQILRAEEGGYENGEWKFRRILNGDQTDRGLIFRGSKPAVVRILLGTF
jgi:beta-galactosidase GanA